MPPRTFVSIEPNVVFYRLEGAQQPSSEGEPFPLRLENRFSISANLSMLCRARGSQTAQIVVGFRNRRESMVQNYKLIVAVSQPRVRPTGCRIVQLILSISHSQTLEPNLKTMNPSLELAVQKQSFLLRSIPAGIARESEHPSPAR